MCCQSEPAEGRVVVVVRVALSPPFALADRSAALVATGCLLCCSPICAAGVVVLLIRFESALLLVVIVAVRLLCLA